MTLKALVGYFMCAPHTTNDKFILFCLFLSTSEIYYLYISRVITQCQSPSSVITQIYLFTIARMSEYKS